MSALDTTIGLESFEKSIGRDSFTPFDYEFGGGDDFIIAKEQREEFIAPVFSVAQTSSNKKWSDTRIVLISAVGASGKSWLAERLSYDLKSPIINLGKMKVVASYSLTGMLNKKLGSMSAGEYMYKLQKGEMGLIIDALDEGFQKTTTDGYFDFLDDVIEKIPAEGSMPIILLGRTNAVELAALHIQEREIDFSILKIEPFTIGKAKEFIDKRVNKKKDNESYKSTYKEIRDYIIDTIGCFFKSQSDINDQRKRFIGYAPVLLAISDYIKGVSNYQKEIISLKQSNKRSVSLIIDITERILARDKFEKVDENLLKNITNHRDKAFQDRVLKNVYLPEEQCARVLYMMLGKSYSLSPIDDEDFNIRYKEGINGWIQEHPFLDGIHPANIVFESYVIAKLALTEKYKAEIDEYLCTGYGNSYIFFYIFNELHKEETLDLSLVPYLYSSLNALEAKNYQHSLDLSLDKYLDNGEIILDAEFDDAADEYEKYEYKVKANSDDELKIGAFLSNANIDIPLSVCLSSLKTELTSPIYISCKGLKVSSGEIIVNSQNGNQKTIIETDKIENITGGNLPCIRTFGNNKGLEIFSPNSLSYPYSDYYGASIQTRLNGFTEKERGYYMKMRKTLIMFRSHSKGTLAKCCSKIDSRVGRKNTGKPVLDALLDKHIIYKKDFMYYLDMDAMDEYLGVSFDGIKECVINDKIKDFVSKIFE